MFRHARIQRVHSVQRRGPDFDRAFAEHRICRRLRAHDLRVFAREERRDERMRTALHIPYRALRDHRAAVRAGARPHFDDPVGRAQHARIVVDDDHGVALRLQIAHHAEQAVHVRRVQANRRLVEHIHRAGQLAAHGARELDALPLAGRQRAAGAVEREVAEPELEQTAGGAREFTDDRLRHLAHVRRHRARHGLHPLRELV